MSRRAASEQAPYKCATRLKHVLIAGSNARRLRGAPVGVLCDQSLPKELLKSIDLCGDRLCDDLQVWKLYKYLTFDETSPFEGDILTNREVGNVGTFYVTYTVQKSMQSGECSELLLTVNARLSNRNLPSFSNGLISVTNTSDKRLDVNWCRQCAIEPPNTTTTLLVNEWQRTDGGRPPSVRWTSRMLYALFVELRGMLSKTLKDAYDELQLAPPPNPNCGYDSM